MFIKLILLILLIVSILTEQHTSNTKNIRLCFRLPVLYVDWLVWLWSQQMNKQTKREDETSYVGLILLTMVLIHTCYPSFLSTDYPSLFILTFEEIYKELENKAFQNAYLPLVDRGWLVLSKGGGYYDVTSCYGQHPLHSTTPPLHNNHPLHSTVPL